MFVGVLCCIVDAGIDLKKKKKKAMTAINPLVVLYLFSTVILVLSGKYEKRCQQYQSINSAQTSLLTSSRIFSPAVSTNI